MSCKVARSLPNLFLLTAASASFPDTFFFFFLFLSSFVDAANKARTAKLVKSKEEMKMCEEIFREVSGLERMPKKRDVLTTLGKSKQLKEKAKRLKCLRALVTQPEFINAFVLSPAKISGFVTLSEFLTFCKCIETVGNLYLRAKDKIREEKEQAQKKEEEKTVRRQKMKKMRAQQAEQRAKEVAAKLEFEAGNIKGVHFRADQRRARDESGEVWKKFHHKCIIRLDATQESYCCESRKRKWEHDIKQFMERESSWRANWADMHDVVKESKRKEITDTVERRIKSGKRRLTKMQKQMVGVLINDMVSDVENRAWVENEVAEVLQGCCAKVSEEESRRLQQAGGEAFFWTERVAGVMQGGDIAEMAWEADEQVLFPSKGRAEELYWTMRDGSAVRSDFLTFWELVHHMESLTLKSLGEFLFRYRFASDEELRAGVYELEMQEGLPEGWQMYENESGQVWYENHVTEESQWERPTRKGRKAGGAIEKEKRENDDEEGEEGGGGAGLKFHGLEKLEEASKKVLVTRHKLADFTSSTTLEAAKTLEVTEARSNESALGHSKDAVKKVSMIKMGMHERLLHARELVKQQEAAASSNDKQPDAHKSADKAGCGRLIGDAAGSKLNIEVFDMDTLSKVRKENEEMPLGRYICAPPLVHHC